MNSVVFPWTPGSFGPNEWFSITMTTTGARAVAEAGTGRATRDSSPTAAAVHTFTHARSRPKPAMIAPRLRRWTPSFATQRGQPQLATQIVRLSGSAVMLPAYAGSGIGIVVLWSVFRSTWKTSAPAAIQIEPKAIVSWTGLPPNPIGCFAWPVLGSSCVSVDP